MIQARDIPDFTERDGFTEAVDAAGYQVRVKVDYDDDMGPPWKEHDGHGPVSEWRATNSKAPGERILVSDRGRSLFYNFAAAVKLARRDGWGFTGQFWYYGHGTYAPTLEAKYMTAGAIAARAAEEDFKRMRQWAEGSWHRIIVCVEVKRNGAHVGDSPSYCGGIEDYTDYWREHAAETARYIIGADIAARKAAAIAKAKETRERKYWAARDVQTKGTK